jgi:hypothetical protein
LIVAGADVNSQNDKGYIMHIYHWVIFVFGSQGGIEFMHD